MSTKECLICGDTFHKKENESKKYWETKKYCSSKCSLTVTKITKQENFGKMPEDFVPWNKGIKYNENYKACLDMSGLEKGRAKGRSVPGLRGPNNPKWNRIEKECLYCLGKFFAEKYREQANKWCNHDHYMKWRRGINNPRFKGNEAISKLRKRIYELPEYQAWIKTCLVRDNYTCQECSKYNGSKHIHHIKGIMKIIQENNIKTVEQARECKELFDINNGQTLCDKCHRKTDSYGRQTTQPLNK